MKKFWMVLGEHSSSCSYRHPSEESAKAEAERLARVNKGEAFIVLAATDAVRVTDTRWVKLGAADEELPF